MGRPKSKSPRPSSSIVSQCINLGNVNPRSVVGHHQQSRRCGLHRLAGQPHEAVDRAKQAQLTRLALAFLKRYRQLEQPARFDVVSIIWEGQTQSPQIVHYRNAFEPPGRGQMFS